MDFLRHLMRLFVFTLSPGVATTQLLLLFNFCISHLCFHPIHQNKLQRPKLMCMPFCYHSLCIFLILSHCTFYSNADVPYPSFGLFYTKHTSHKKITCTDLLQFSLENTLIIKSSHMTRNMHSVTNPSILEM